MFLLLLTLKIIFFPDWNKSNVYFHHRGITENMLSQAHTRGSAPGQDDCPSPGLGKVPRWGFASDFQATIRFWYVVCSCSFFLKTQERAREVAQVVECLPSIHKTWTPQHHIKLAWWLVLLEGSEWEAPYKSRDMITPAGGCFDGESISLRLCFQANLPFSPHHRVVSSPSVHPSVLPSPLALICSYNAVSCPIQNTKSQINPHL